MIAMLIGPFQFLSAVRRRYSQVHRWLGCAYLTSVAAGYAAVTLRIEMPLLIIMAGLSPIMALLGTELARRRDLGRGEVLHEGAERAGSFG
jgi:hypothetical protein